ncbi:MAG TPA: helix-turn-helix domain-containing protein [Solirubrobacteraceae bacterium]
MDPAWLAEKLATGRSIESLAREAGRSPSTVAYWVNKHGLRSTHASRHAARGGIERATLAALVEEGLSIRQMADRLGLSYTAVRHWLARYELATPRARRLASTRAARAAGAAEATVDCPVHGPTRHIRRSDGGLRCLACRSAAVASRRQAVKAILVAEAGGACVLCGYAASTAALHFHHRNPAEKSFGLGETGLTRALARARAEAAKCVLLCATCHAEVEKGVKRLPC